MTRIRTRDDLKRRWRLWFISIAALLVFGLGSVAWVLFAGRALQPPQDEITLCPDEDLITEEHLVVVDASDSLNVLQRRVVQDVFADVQESVPRFGRLHLYAIDRSGVPIPQASLVLCNPGQPEDLEDMTVLGAWTDEFLANPGQMRELWRRAFAQRIDSVFLAEASLPSAPQSRLMETIRGASLDAFGRSIERSNRPHYVHIFSDMLQNSEAFSHYDGGGWSANAAESLADPGALGTRALEGAQVRIYLIDRPIVRSNPSGTRKDLVLFWDRYFSAQGAVVTRIERIEG